MIALKVEWALYQTSKKFGLVHDVSQQTECKALRQLTSGDQDQPELQGSSESLLYAKGEMLYNVRCPRIEASLDITTADERCYKYLPVIAGNPPTRRFLIPGSRLLSNVSEVEDCNDAKKVPRGYLSTGGHWVAADPRERGTVTSDRVTTGDPHRTGHVRKRGERRSLHGSGPRRMGKSIHMGYPKNDQSDLRRQDLTIIGFCSTVPRGND